MGRHLASLSPQTGEDPKAIQELFREGEGKGAVRKPALPLVRGAVVITLYNEDGLTRQSISSLPIEADTDFLSPEDSPKLREAGGRLKSALSFWKARSSRGIALHV